MEPISFRFPHGLGDCANFAHVVKMYVDRGHPVEVEVDASKHPLFLSAGATITPHGRDHHEYLHPPGPGRPGHLDHWSGSKIAFNVSQPPLPFIGYYVQLWPELCAVKLDLEAFVTDRHRDAVADYFGKLPRPIVLCHFQGNTGVESKNLSWEEQEKCLRGLLDRTDGTMILLDWDNRLFRLNSYRVRHLGDDWRGLETLELYEAIKQADLLIGVDSGPLHLARFTKTPTLGVWTHHFPSHFALPRRQTLNLVCDRGDWTSKRRIGFNLVDGPDRQDGSFIAEVASKMLSPWRYMPGATAAEDVLLQHLVGKVRTFDSPLTGFVDRHRSFDLVMKLASERLLTKWVETGCIRSVDDWTAGFATYVFGLYLRGVKGHLDSVELDGGNAQFAREWTVGLPVEVHQAHSHDYLRGRTTRVDVAYLDSADVGTDGYQECCLEEARLVLPNMADNGLILIDDTCWGKGAFRGKGTMAIPFLLEQGWRIVYAGYQVLLSR